jgi:hypothetical protein
MGCCGQKRAASAQAPAKPTPLFGTVAPAAPGPPSPAPAATATAPVRAHSEVRVRYSERSAIRVRGTATGRVYDFSAAAPVQAVDRLDATAMLASRFFSGTI